MVILVAAPRLLVAQDARWPSPALLVGGRVVHLHRVEAGQTLYSIARAHASSVEEIKRANGREDDVLSPGETLRVPRLEPYRALDDAYYYHVSPGEETLQAIARQFGVRARLVARENPAHGDRETLTGGTIIRVPLQQADRAAIARVLQRQEEARQAALTLAEEEARAAEPPPPAEEPVHETRVSVLLPFGIEENTLPSPFEQIETDERGEYLHDERWRLSPRSLPVLEFYGGLLVAADSLKRAGHSIILQVLDTGRDSLPRLSIVTELDAFSPHLVIGPARAATYEQVAARLSRRDVPLVYPFSSRGGGLERFPCFVQINGSVPARLDAMASWVASRGHDGHLLAIVPPPAGPGEEERELPGRTRRYLDAGEEAMTLFEWDGTTPPPFKELLREGVENIVLFPTLDETLASRLLPLLSAWAERYRVTVVGFPEWLKFTAVDEETFFKLNLTVFQTTRVEGESPAALAFARRYRESFHADPSPMACKGYDFALLFLRHAALHRERSLDALAGLDATGLFTRFLLAPLPGMPGIENRGFFKINYSPSFEINVTPSDAPR
ncbi:MAG: LysM peptidoglycan-binding domain-containing protein [Odoribacteraceae bacterium]|nr:LysM peptidoglycan-binding domain-containing protein [Odoribacteraceae bacterium]